MFFSGQTFSTKQELLASVAAFEEETQQKFKIYNATSLTKKCIEKGFNKEMEYKQLYYICTHAVAAEIKKKKGVSNKTFGL